MQQDSILSWLRAYFETGERSAECIGASQPGAHVDWARLSAGSLIENPSTRTTSAAASRGRRRRSSATTCSSARGDLSALSGAPEPQVDASTRSAAASAAQDTALTRLSIGNDRAPSRQPLPPDEDGPTSRAQPRGMAFLPIPTPSSTAQREAVEHRISQFRSSRASQTAGPIPRRYRVSPLATPRTVTSTSTSGHGTETSSSSVGCIVHARLQRPVDRDSDTLATLRSPSALLRNPNAVHDVIGVRQRSASPEASCGRIDAPLVVKAPGSHECKHSTCAAIPGFRDQAGS
jgi:hypothetical protein